MRIIFATGNADKLREIREILSDCDVSVCSLKDLGLTSNADENGKTFAENSYIKAREIYDMVFLTGPESGDISEKLEAFITCGRDDIVIMADDSGLCIDFFDGGPGVQSARFMGHDTSYDIKNAAILEQMCGVPDEKRGAAFVCHVCALCADGTRYDAEGRMTGMIAHEPCGRGGFGYDPVFFLPEKGCTSAELTDDEKNAISHRGAAIRAMRDILCGRGIMRMC